MRPLAARDEASWDEALLADEVIVEKAHERKWETLSQTSSVIDAMRLPDSVEATQKILAEPAKSLNLDSIKHHFTKL